MQMGIMIQRASAMDAEESVGIPEKSRWRKR